MFRIGEFSKLTQVSVRMLRYYDEAGILTPAVVDKWTGHRLYSMEQIPRLNKILYLRDSGLNVSEIALALTMDEQSLFEQLGKKRMEIEDAIQADPCVSGVVPAESCTRLLFRGRLMERTFSFYRCTKNRNSGQYIFHLSRFNLGPFKNTSITR